MHLILLGCMVIVTESSIVTGLKDPRFKPGSYGTMVALVPFNIVIEPDVDETLRAMEVLGITVWRRQGRFIDHLRSTMAYAALEAGFEEILWVDADTKVEVSAVDMLRSWDLPLVGCAIAQKGQKRLASQFMVAQQSIQLGVGGGLVEVRHTGTGVMYTRAEVYRKIQVALQLPTCDTEHAKKGDFQALVPWFEPMIATGIPGLEGKHMYLAEDYAFVERARRVGYKAYVDTRIRNFHIGKYSFTWEDTAAVGGLPPRGNAYTYKF